MEVMGKPRLYGMLGAYKPNNKADLWRKPKQYTRQKKAASRRKETGDERKNQAAQVADA